LLEKLSALVPPPRLHLIRYHGVLVPASADRGQIVPGPSALTSASDGGVCDGVGVLGAGPRRQVHRVEWARLPRAAENLSGGLAHVLPHTTLSQLHRPDQP